MKNGKPNGRKKSPIMEVQIGAKIGSQMGGKRLQNGGPNWCKNEDPNAKKKVPRKDVQLGAKMGSQMERKRFPEWRSKLNQN